MRLISVSWVVAAAVCPTGTPAAAQLPAEGGTAPSSLLGEFVDDYGARYTITPEAWRHGEGSRYDIVEWNAEERYAVARNARDNPTDGGLWTRIDWVTLDDGGEYPWAYCYAVFRAPTAVAARAGPSAMREAPRSGCNGFPFTRMRRVDPAPVP